jgi:uncharacterized protein
MSARLPAPDADSAPFWDGLEKGELRIPECRACGRQFFPPIPSCPRCGAAGPELRVVSGTGRVYSWVTIHLTLDPEFADDVPYTIVAVELDGGGRMLGRLIGDGLPAGEAEVAFAPYRSGDQLLPGFRLRSTEA